MPTCSAGGPEPMGKDLLDHRRQPGHRARSRHPDEPRAGVTPRARRAQRERPRRDRRACDGARPGRPRVPTTSASSTTIPTLVTGIHGSHGSSTSCSTSPATRSRSRCSTPTCENLVTTFTMNVFAMLS